MAVFSRIREYFRDESTSPLEKRLVFKNYLDRSSVTQAYVSGMKEDLGFVGAQLTEVTTLYAVGYLV
ncbi:hypothetical protein KJ359_005501 [Pestalotiopsis sp. 9143b]|nr:hypothetical protein KJ359_005501 [Pestalotiopsis sp. 9143b]